MIVQFLTLLLFIGLLPGETLFTGRIPYPVCPTPYLSSLFPILIQNSFPDYIGGYNGVTLHASPVICKLVDIVTFQRQYAVFQVLWCHLLTVPPTHLLVSVSTPRPNLLCICWIVGCGCDGLSHKSKFGRWLWVLSISQWRSVPGYPEHPIFTTLERLWFVSLSNLLGITDFWLVLIPMYAWRLQACFWLTLCLTLSLHTRAFTFSAFAKVCVIDYVELGQPCTVLED